MDFLADVVRWFAEGDHWRGTFGVPNRVVEHVQVSAAAVLTALALALPVALTLGHLGRGGVLAVNLSNVGRALPSFAILVLAQEVFGIGFQPVYLAMVALAVPPIMTNTYVGVRQVDAEAREAARGMGMTGGQMLLRVEIPMAAPLIMAGARTAAVQVVATATLGAVVAGPGLGRYIVDGLAQGDNPQAFAGAALVALLAVVTEVGFGAGERLLAHRGRRPGVENVVAPPPVAGTEAAA